MKNKKEQRREINEHMNEKWIFFFSFDFNMTMHLTISSSFSERE